MSFEVLNIPLPVLVLDLDFFCFQLTYINEILNEGITQLSGKYLATETVDEGYLVVFDTRTPVGTGFMVMTLPRCGQVN